MRILSLSALAALLFVQCAVGQPYLQSYVSPDGNYKTSWKLSGGFIEVTVSAKTTGWVAWGYKDGITGPHVNTDIIVGNVVNGVPQLFEKYSTVVGTPSDVPENPNKLVRGSEANGWTTIVFKRLIAPGADGVPPNYTNPSPAIPIFSQNRLIQWAYGETDDFRPHTPAARGSFVANLYNRAPTPLQPGATKGSFASRDGKYKASWTVFNGYIEITMSAKTLGYVAFGYNEKGNNKPHVDTSIIAGSVSAQYGLFQVDEYDSRDIGDVRSLFVNPNFVINGYQVDGWTTLTFSRPIKTIPGSVDFVTEIPNAPILVQWAYGDDNSLGQHSATARGSLLINLLADSSTVAPTPLPTPVRTPVRTPAPTRNRRSFSSPDGAYNVSWAVTGDLIEITMSAKTKGWVAFGYKQSNSQPHVDVDMIVGTFSTNTGNAEVFERSSRTLGPAPSLLFGNPNWVLAGSENNGVTTITFNRPLTVEGARARGFPILHPIPDKVVLVHWAYGSIDTFTQHAPKARGTFSVNLLR